MGRVEERSAGPGEVQGMVSLHGREGIRLRESAAGARRRGRGIESGQPVEYAAPSSLQIQTAVRDADCKQSTGLLTTWIKELDRDQEALLTPNLLGLRQGIQQFDALITAEQKLVAHAG